MGKEDESAGKSELHEHKKGKVARPFNTRSSAFSVRRLAEWARVWLREHFAVHVLVSLPLALALKHVWEATVAEETVVIGGNISTGSLPISIGLAVYLLFSLWLLTSIIVSIKLTDIRNRIKQMEGD